LKNRKLVILRIPNGRIWKFQGEHEGWGINAAVQLLFRQRLNRNSAEHNNISNVVTGEYWVLHFIAELG
jgi:hypothetical protein